MKRYLMSFGLVLVAVMYVALLLRHLNGYFDKDEASVSPHVVSMAPSPTSAPTPSFSSTSAWRHSRVYPTASPVVTNSPMSSGSGATMHIWTTSSARVQNIGGGGGGQGIATTSSSGSSSRGINYSSSSIAVPNFIAMASTRQVAEPEAQSAPEMARVITARRAPGPPTETDPPSEHQLNDQPIGDGLWALMVMAMLCGGVIAVKRVRKEQN